MAATFMDPLATLTVNEPVCVTEAFPSENVTAKSVKVTAG